MTESGRPWWKRIVQRVFMTRPFAWIGLHVFGRIDPILMRLTKGHVYASRGMGLLSILLTTTGAKSGLPRKATLLAFEDGEDLFVIASRGGNPRHHSWYHNLKANRSATVVWNGRKETRIAHEADSPERERLWQKAMDTFPTFDRYQERTGGRRVPVIVLQCPATVSPSL
ncbi:MAG: nitroreductase/quinone reductase family protein [Myxococcota bacterium]